jgi:hypothetical protein
VIVTMRRRGGGCGERGCRDETESCMGVDVHEVNQFICRRKKDVGARCDCSREQYLEFAAPQPGDSNFSRR